MRKGRNIWKRILAVLLSVSLVLNGVPTTSICADEVPNVALADKEAPDEEFSNDTYSDSVENGELTTTEIPYVDELYADTIETDEHFEAVPSDSNTIPVDNNTEAIAEIQQQVSEQTQTAVDFAEGTLEESVQDAEGHRVDVSVTCDRAAEIPMGTTLHVRVLDDNDELHAAAQRVDNALGLSETERVIDATYVSISLEAEGAPVIPASPIHVAVSTDGISDDRAPLLEAVFIGEDTEWAITDTRIISNGGLRHFSFNTDQCGIVAMDQVVKCERVFSDAGKTVNLLVPRNSFVTCEKGVAPELSDGIELVGCLKVTVNPATVQTVWVEATGINENDKESTSEESVCGQIVSSGVVVGELFGAEGTKEPLPLQPNNQQLLLTRDSGLRTTKLSFGDVTVEGMLPEGCGGSSRDVTEDFADPTSLPEESGNTSQLQAQSEEYVFEAIAAYDISLVSKGSEYEPDEKHPLKVTIKDDSISEDRVLEVWHIKDDGQSELVRETTVVDGSVTFVATGFSTYLLVAQNETTTTGISTFFKVKATASSYNRTSMVTFVDTDGKSINGTTKGTLVISYTGTGPEPNETNRVDFYAYKDTLESSIAPEYDFSRVYVTLAKGSIQKDFRYMQVADETAIGATSSTPIYRAYFYMDDISQNASNQDYNGTWYQLSMGGSMDNIFIEYYHVAEASFMTYDTRKDPVENAEFTLYVDQYCYKPFEYKHAEVVAESDRSGCVSFGKIPRGTYYMKETSVPEGYKRSTTIYKVVVDETTTLYEVLEDGTEEINYVEHEDDDGSIIISDVLRMNLVKKWNDGQDHSMDSVVIRVEANGQTVDEVTLSAKNNWKARLDDLDPNLSYLVSETSVTSDGADVTNDWIPDIEYEEQDSHYEYYKTDELLKGRQFVLITTTANGTRALSGGNTLTTTPLEINDYKITGTVTDAMVWNAETVNLDGVIALKNEASKKYLDQNGRWFLNNTYPAPLYVRHNNNDGVAKIYHRKNLNDAAWIWLYVWPEGAKEGQVDRASTKEESLGSTWGTDFDIYRKVYVRSVDVTITNKAPTYPIRVKNVIYPTNDGLPGAEFELSRKGEQNTVTSTLTAGADGYLNDSEGNSTFDLSAGTYILTQTKDLSSDGYAKLEKPVRFTITRGGSLRVTQEDQELSGFDYSSNEKIGDNTYLLLQVPNYKLASVEVTFELAGDYANLQLPFDFELEIPDIKESVSGSVNGEPYTFTSTNRSFTLKHGQVLKLENVPAAATYTITQKSSMVASKKVDGDGLYQASCVSPNSTATTTLDGKDERIMRFSALNGTSDNPAQVTLTDTLGGRDVPETGLSDNTGIWAAISMVCLALFAVLYLRRRRFRV